MRIRVYEIAKKLNCSSKELAIFINGLGIDVRGHSSTLSQSTAEVVSHEYLSQNYEELKEAYYKKLEKERLQRLEENGPSFVDYALNALNKRLEGIPKHDETLENCDENQAQDNIEEVTVTSWSHFNNIVSDLRYREWVFRGQSDSSWQLETTLYRAFKDVALLRKQNTILSERAARNNYESILIKHFKANAHLHLNNLPKDEDTLEWLAVMQHYGAPTRLLDFTYSPHIALFFSLSDATTDSSVFCFPKRALMVSPYKTDKEKTIFENSLLKEDSYLQLFEPVKTNKRLHKQQGLFVVPSNNYESVNEIVSNSDHEYSSEGLNLIIPKDIQFEMIDHLKKINVTASMLFPGIEGYTQTLKYLLLEENELL